MKMVVSIPDELSESAEQFDAVYGIWRLASRVRLLSACSRCRPVPGDPVRDGSTSSAATTTPDPWYAEHRRMVREGVEEHAWLEEMG